MDLSYRALMTSVATINIVARFWSVEITLIYVVVFRAHVKLVNFTVREIYAVRIYMVFRLILLSLCCKSGCVYSSGNISGLFRAKVGRDL